MTKVYIPFKDQYLLAGQAGDGAELYLDGNAAEVSGSYKLNIEIESGYHLIALKDQEINLSVFDQSGKQLNTEIPVLMADSREMVWLYAGPFQRDEIIDLKKILDFRTPFHTAHGTAEGSGFWRVDLPESYIRPFNEQTLYGEWNYPLGVTLYGMIQTARLLNSSHIHSYVEGHMKKCAGYYPYCMWDKDTYGAAPFHNQLTTIDSLDDCGSFASAMLEVMKDHKVENGGEICEMVADYMIHRQQRLEDGTFYRNHSYMPIMNETIWADDMYMSIPFLCRYFEYSKDVKYIQEAAEQVKHFYRYLYMPELKIMSHIYDTHYQVQTKVPWGRGNGWVLFSLTELLAVMPEDHPERSEILDIYSRLCEGYLSLQGEEGMWHQVLTFPDSYQETSCTAMFIYSFARGVRYGWLNEAKKYEESARRGWEALCKISIDWHGNIYGVCRGSGYSFSKDYYASELGWIKNDTHGTGIVMLAGIEVEKMKDAKCS